MKNTPNTPEIQGKISEILWNMRKPIKVFGSHDKIIWSIKIRLCLQKSENGSWKIPTKFVETA